MKYQSLSSGHSQRDMVVQSFGRKVSFGWNGDAASWQRTTLQLWPLIVGVATVASLLLLGSFFRNLVSRKKKDREKLTPFADLYPRATHKPNTVVALREFTKPVPSSSPQKTNNDQDKRMFFDALVFDAEHDYAEVLAEARSHASTSPTSANSKLAAPKTQLPKVQAPPSSPVSKSSTAKSPVAAGSTKQQQQHPVWLTRSSSARCHNPFFDEDGLFHPDQEAELEKRLKSSKSWKKLLFWKKSKKSNVYEFNGSGVALSSCTTPLHYMFKSSRTRATVAPTTPPRLKRPVPKRTSSGPLYNDGTPYTPNRNGRPVSGPLSGSSTPSREGLVDSPYLPLKKPSSTPKVCAAPLYVS